MTTRVEKLARHLSLGGVFVLGAGMSLVARYPDTFGLNALLWDALDTDPTARADLAAGLGLTDAPAKALIGDDFSKWEKAWQTIASSQIARHRFQHEFVTLDSHRADASSVSHEALARLIHRGDVELVISFNWDSALERAYERVYGVRLPTGVLHKPHGDVAHPELPWTLPHEDGLVGNDLQRRIADMAADHARTLVVVGYSERDKAVVEGLIDPLDQRWRVCRVGPNVTGDDDVPGTAADVLSALAAPIAQHEDDCCWTVVTFENQRGLEAALEGRRLSQRDVDACPPLPEVGLAGNALRRVFAVVLNGESGSGKSITAYQVANQLRQDGYEVLRLRDRAKGSSPRNWLTDLSAFPRQKLLLVDDAQDLSTDTVRELADAADANTFVLVAGVDHVAGSVTTIHVGAATAVGTLERHVLEHADDLLPKLRKLDEWIGDGIGDERLTDRVREAAHENTAWQFFYILTGGWRRTTRALHEVRDSKRADLLACALAVAQIAGVDSGVTVEELLPYASALQRDREWVERNLSVLRECKLAMEDEGVWRTTHLRTAYAILGSMLHPPAWRLSPTTTPTVPPIATASGTLKPAPAPTLSRPRRPQSHLPANAVEADRNDTATLLNYAVRSSSISLRGLAWLLGRQLPAESGWVLRNYGVRSPAIDKALAERALSTPPGAEVGMAAQLLEQLDGPNSSVVTTTIWKHIDKVIAWVETLSPSDGWAVGSLINVLHNDDKDALSQAISGVDPASVTALIEAGGWPHIYSSMKAVDRIAQGGGIAFQRAVGAAVDEVAMDRMLDRVPDLHAANELLGGLAFLNPDLGIRLFEKHAVRLAQLFSPDPVGRFHDLLRTFAFLLRTFSMFGRDTKPPANARQAARVFFRAINTGPLIKELSRPKDDRRWHNFHSFLSSFADTDPRGWKQVIGNVDLDVLESELVNQLPRPDRNLLYVLHLMAEHRRDAVLAMLDRHGNRFGALDPFLVYLYPQLSVTLIEAGLPLDLELYHQQYGGAAELLSLIGTHSPSTAREVAIANFEAFREGLAQNVHPPLRDLSKWLAEVDRWAPGLVDDALAKLPAGVVVKWADALRSTGSKKEVGRLVVRAAASGSAPSGVEARELMRRFTSLQRI